MIVQAQAPKAKNATSNFIPTGKRCGMQMFYGQARLVYSTAFPTQRCLAQAAGRRYATIESPASPSDCRAAFTAPITASPVIKSPPNRVEVVKSEKIIRDRSHRRDDDRRGHRFAALNRSLALDAISSAIADVTETPDNEGNQACCRQERGRR